MPADHPVCTYTRADGHGCGRRPPVAHYYSSDPLRGTRPVASLCADHDTEEAQKVAKKEGLTRLGGNS